MAELYSLFDSFLCEYLPPFVAKNDKVASISYEAYLKQHPLEFEHETQLYHIGSFDSDTGLLKLADKNKLLGVYSGMKEDK